MGTKPVRATRVHAGVQAPRAKAPVLCSICDEVVERGAKLHLTCEDCQTVYHRACVLGVGYCVNVRCVSAHPALGRGTSSLPPALQPVGRALSWLGTLELPVSRTTLKVVLGTAVLGLVVVVGGLLAFDSSDPPGEVGRVRPAITRRRDR